MIRLPHSLQQWGKPGFEETLKRELLGLQPGSLPLHLATVAGGRVDDDDLAITLLHASLHGDALNGRLGIFFSEVVGGCNCSDDPVSSPVYCEIYFSIDCENAGTVFSMNKI